ncbi:MAG: restriction endonuclease subunit S, partial [Candidatus Diapherotrites archaeon]|nr:restriction endonuclease subunit S [Candidatus Diapherotrites archaeon]
AELKSISIGTNTKYLTLGLFKGIKLIVPQVKKQKQFAEVASTFKIINEKQQQSETEINSLFDCLMQKAFNGELVN